MWSWRRRDTCEAIHRILIDATLKAFRARIHGNLRNPISQLLLLLLRAKTEFYPHPRVVNWKSFVRFLFARIWLENWILGRFSLKSLGRNSVRQNCVFPASNGRGEAEIKLNPLSGIFEPRPSICDQLSSANIFYNRKAFPPNLGPRWRNSLVEA